MADLRNLLRQRGIKVSGKKADLLRRLRVESSSSSSSTDMGPLPSEENEEKERTVSGMKAELLRQRKVELSSSTNTDSLQPPKENNGMENKEKENEENDGTVSRKKADLSRRLKIVSSSTLSDTDPLSPKENKEKVRAVSGKKVDFLRRLKVEWSASLPSSSSNADPPPPIENEEKENKVPSRQPTALGGLAAKKPSTIARRRRPLGTNSPTIDTYAAQRGIDMKSPAKSGGSRGKGAGIAFWSSSQKAGEAGGVKDGGIVLSPGSKRMAKKPVTQSAKKRRRKSMAVAVTKALEEVGNALNK